MALVLKDRVQETSVSTGTGTVTLGGAVAGYQSFNTSTPSGSVVYYCIAAQTGTDWEVGYGTFTSPDQLSRTVVYSSSNASALVNFPSGTKNVFVTYPAEQAVFQQPSGITEFNEGPISVVGANATPASFSATLAQFFSNEPGYSQLFVQNQSNDANASSDIVAYNNLGDGTNYFVDVGINSSTYNSADYPIFQANDTYLFAGGNTAGTGASGDIARLMIGTSTANSNVVIFGGSVNVNATIATFVASTKNVNFANGIAVTGNASANNITLTNLAYAAGNVSAGANNTVLTTKAYVDSAVATGFTVHDPCVYATTADLGSVTYNNGTLGVGATLTNAGTQAALVIDGYTFTATDVTNSTRVLIKNQSNAAYNGAYTVTNQGSGSTNWVLTRATDFDTAGAGEIANNAYFFITAGSANINDSFILSQLTSPIVVGTTTLPFTLFSNQLVYTGTAPINVSGTTISLTGIVPIANGGTNLSSYTTGDTLYANATNTLTRRAIGASNTVLVSNGSVPDWGTVALGSASAVSGTLGATNGGTGQAAYTLGDIIYSNATNSLARLSGQITTTQKFLSQTGTGAASAAPVWDTIPAGSITGLGTMSTQNANAVTITGGTLNNVVIGGTTANAGTFTTATATLFAGSGANLTNLNASNVSTGTIDNARTTAATANGASTIVLRDAGGNFAANTITANLTGTASSATSATSATTATNIAGGAAGGIPYQTGASTTVILATGTGVLVGGTTPAYSTTPTLTGTNFSSIPNSATTASAANGASTIVARDINGSFTANVVTATHVGDGSGLSALNAANVTSGTLPNARLSAVPNSALANSSTTINGTAIALGASGTITAVNPNALTISSPLTGTSYNGSAAVSIGIPVATSSVNGYLSSTDWSTFNSKGAGTVTSVSGTGSANGLTLSGTVTTSGSLTLGGSVTSVASGAITRAMMYTGSNDGNAVLCGADGAIFLNPTTIASSTTIPANYNGMSAGPITINTGVTVTVSTGAAWVIN